MSNPMVIQPDDSCDHLLEEPRVLSTKSDHLDALDQSAASRTTQPAKTTFHCGQCRTIFGSRTAVRAHRKMNTCRKKQEAPCSSEHEHEPLRLQFDSMDAALNWRLENQLDRYFSFKGTKSTGGVPGSYRMLRCNQNVRDKQIGAKKSKKTHLCSAKITFSQTRMCCCPDPQSEVCSNARSQVSVYGCVAHSHPLERKNIRLSTSIKDRTAALLTSGITPEVVIDKYLSTNDMDPESKPVTYHDIYRIKKNLNLNGYDGKASEVRNVSSLLVDPSFHGFNYGKKFDMSSMSKDIADKVIETSGYFLLTYASPDMIQRFHDHPTTISIDGTHGTNAAKYVLISILVFYRRGEGSPVFQALVENENQIVFSAALTVLKSIAPEACGKVKALISDTSHTFINSWREIVQQHVVWSVCHWHLEKSWARKIRNADMFKDIKSLRQVAELTMFSQKLLNIQSK